MQLPENLKEPATIVRVVRRLRGGSFPALVEVSSGQYYVVKFCHNPQGNRTLINEAIGSAVMRRVGIATPPLRVLTCPQEIGAQLHSTFEPDFMLCPKSLQHSLHLGSECPADPDRVAIWDFLPRNLLPRVANLRDLGRAFVVDRWLNQVDSRQAIFFNIDSHPRRQSCYQASLIDHGFNFQGADWRLNKGSNAPLRGLYVDRFIYCLLDMEELCKETLDRVMEIGNIEIHSIAESLPDCWFRDGERTQLKNLIAALCLRKLLLPNLVGRQLQDLQRLTSQTEHIERSNIQKELHFA